MSDRNLERAASGSFDAQAIRPTDIKLRRNEQELRIRWADGSESVYSAALLRRNCPCATCRSARQPAGPTSLPVLNVQADQRIELTGARLVGNYALQLLWSDSHDTGIFDYRYLRTLE